VGLTTVADKRAKGFSLGMGQRLGIATALLADPSILILDEPVNGLDPEGILWVRNLLKHMATQGKTVFVSSHLMSEMALTADHLIVIGRGKLIANAGVNDVIQMSTTTHVRVRSPHADALAELIAKGGGTVVRPPDGSLSITGMTAEAVGELAASKRVVLHELVLVQASLEEAFMELTEDSVDFRAPATDGAPSDAFPNHGGAA
jgi:ABC-2 type transport system ATP-binding protein